MAVFPEPPDWSLSVVSHGHIAQVRRLLEDFRARLDPAHVEVILTLNIAEPAEGLEHDPAVLVAPAWHMRIGKICGGKPE